MRVRILDTRDHSQGVLPRIPAPTDSATPDLVAAYVEHAGFVERVLRRAGVAARDVPDARQDVFVVAHRRLSSFEGRGRLSTWLYRIAWNVASEYRRRACHRREQLDDVACGASERCAADEGLALRLEHRELLGHALSALDTLDDDKREAFVLAEIVGLSMRQVAARVGCPVKTAFSRAYAARRRMLATLRERGIVLGVLPAWLPLQLHAARMPVAVPRGGGQLLGAQAQLALVAFACVALPPVLGAGEGSVRTTAGGNAHVRAAALAADTQLGRDDGARPAHVAPAGVPSDPAPRLRQSPRSRSRSRSGVDRGARAAIEHPLAPTLLPAPELIVVRDGQAWLVPAVEHPLDREPAEHPALPPIVHRRGPRHELGRWPAELPSFEL